MASKKPASKVRKAAKPPARPAARKASAHRAEARKAPASTQRAGSARAAARGGARPATRPAAKGAAALAAAAKTAPATPATPERPAKTAAAAGKAGPAASRNSPLPVITTVRTGVRTVPDADESDGADPGSLLAGPRNVKPYVARRGEQYMGKQQLAHFHQILTNWKRDLMMEVDRTVTHMKDEAANFPDPNDRATQEEEFSLELRTRDRERKLIRKIDEALKRVEDGTYGYCLETGEEIGIKRLEARPVATLSLEAQERRERRERQYGDRDDRYR
ncbi:MAG TPA: RNA polymerase-binding protein DksA [Steroidobacteraceae bacterium]|nr:RNA polymerase-binding protein DksA [Steroidobacteraceae bacterium]